jgi:hypothetical protein
MGNPHAVQLVIVKVKIRWWYKYYINPAWQYLAVEIFVFRSSSAGVSVNYADRMA